MRSGRRRARAPSCRVFCADGAVSLVLVIGLGFLLLASMLSTTAIAALHHYITVETPYSQFSLALLNAAVSFLLATALFAAIYKILPNKDLEWGDVVAGAFATAALFQLGQILLGYFLGSGTIARPYGAAGGLIVLLIWVYYSAQVFLLGAEFTKVYACLYGSQQCRPEDASIWRQPAIELENSARPSS